MVKNKIKHFSILILVLLVVFLSLYLASAISEYTGDKTISVLLMFDKRDNSARLIDLKIIPVEFQGTYNEAPGDGKYKIETLSSNNNVLSSFYTAPSFSININNTGITEPVSINRDFKTFFIPFTDSIRYIKVLYNTNEILSIDVPTKLCNDNNICEKTKDIFENYFSCSDCTKDSEDEICASVSDDGICDPDCISDSDCKFPGDLNGDGKTDYNDLGLVSLTWGCESGESCFNPDADLNNDGIVDFEDLGFFSYYWNQGPAAGAGITGQAVKETNSITGNVIGLEEVNDRKVYVKRSVSSSYIKGQNIKVNLKTSYNKKSIPEMFGVQEKIPQGWEVISAQPNYFMYNREKGLVYWQLNQADLKKGISYEINASGNGEIKGNYLAISGDSYVKGVTKGRTEIKEKSRRGITARIIDSLREIFN